MLALTNTSNYVLRMTDRAECVFNHSNMSKEPFKRAVQAYCFLNCKKRKERERNKKTEEETAKD